MRYIYIAPLLRKAVESCGLAATCPRRKRHAGFSPRDKGFGALNVGYEPSRRGARLLAITSDWIGWARSGPRARPAFPAAAAERVARAATAPAPPHRAGSRPTSARCGCG